jgi:hypothetical protein
LIGLYLLGTAVILAFVLVRIPLRAAFVLTAVYFIAMGLLYSTSMLPVAVLGGLRGLADPYSILGGAILLLVACWRSLREKMPLTDGLVLFTVTFLLAGLLLLVRQVLAANIVLLLAVVVCVLAVVRNHARRKSGSI